jgi:hypothetical protein
VERKRGLLSNGRRTCGLGKRGDDKFFEGYMVRRTDDERSFGDHVNRERIFNDYVDRRLSDFLTTRFGEKVMENGP